MIAFDAADAALEWALLVQEALLEVTWSSQVGSLAYWAALQRAATSCGVKSKTASGH